MELHEVLYVLSMTKNLFLVSCLTYLKCRVEFDDQEVIIRSYSPDPCYPRYLGITRRSCLEAHMVLDMEYREQE